MDKGAQAIVQLDLCSGSESSDKRPYKIAETGVRSFSSGGVSSGPACVQAQLPAGVCT